MDEQVKYWIELADYDLDTARVMLNTGRYLYVGFMCHQVVEKMLKAYYAATTGEIPPFTHNIELLARKSGLDCDFSQDQLDFVRQLEPLNVQSRYPTDRELLIQSLTETKCRRIFDQTTEIHKWINQKLSN